MIVLSSYLAVQSAKSVKRIALCQASVLVSLYTAPISDIIQLAF